MPYMPVKTGNQICVHRRGPDGKPMGESMGCHDNPADAAKQIAALYAKEPKAREALAAKSANDLSAQFEPVLAPLIEATHNHVELQEREFDTAQRKQLAAKGAAMPDGSFPIVTRQDLENAIQAIGRASNPAAAKTHIKKRARALGLTKLLPKEWQNGGESSESMRTVYVAEPVTLAESTIDDEHMAVRGVTLIRAGFSKNTDRAGRPRYYAPAVLQRDARVFEGAQVHVNHPTKAQQTDQPEGDALGIRGWYENVKWDAARNAVIGDQVLIDRESTRKELWPVIKEAVNRPDLIQLSINALGKQTIGKAEGRDAIVVESIMKGSRPNRVDIVTTGAAGGSYAGALLAADGDALTRDLLAAMTFEEWRTTHPEFVEQLKTEWKTIRQDGALDEARSELDELKDKIVHLQEASRANDAELLKYRRGELADRLLADSGLPNKLRDTIRAELLNQDETAMRETIKRERAKYAAVPRQPVAVSGAGQRKRETDMQPDTKPAPIHEAFGIRDKRLLPKDGETPEQWHKRVKQL